MEKIIAVIPARMASSRLPGKVLREIDGRPMLAYVVEAARSSKLLSQVIVATDSDEVAALCKQHGWDVRMTSDRHSSGTDRVHEVACALHADIYVNVQGDEPLARSEHIEALLAPFLSPSSSEVMVSTVKTPCPISDVSNPNAVKVVTDLSGRALYFSRAPIPFDRDGAGRVRHFKHLGFYAYRKAALDRFSALPPTELELSERLEQLRFLDNGISIQVAETAYDSVGVDTEDDLRHVEKIIKSR